MKVLFVVPVKNEESRIGACLRSIKESFIEGVDCKITVVDNGSSDNTAAIAGEFANFVFVRPKDTVAGLRNYAANLFDCDYIVFIDADVVVSKLFLKNALCHFNDKDVAIVTGCISIPTNNTWVQRAWALNRKDTPVVRLSEWSSSMNMIVRKGVFEEIGGFLPFMTTCEDVEFSMRVREKYKIVYDHDVKVTHFGEAKDLIDLFRKERWRGKSSIRLLFLHSRNLMRWVSFMQIPFFVSTILLLIFSMSSKKFGLIVMALCGCLVLPLLRAFLTCIRNHCLSMVPSVMVVWLVYYFARTVALFDGFVELWRDKCKLE